MLRLVMRAIAAQRAQTFAVLALAAVAFTATITAPWYVLSAAQRAADSDLHAAPAGQRIVSVSVDHSGSDDPHSTVEELRTKLDGSMPVAGHDIAGMAAFVSAPLNGLPLPVRMAYRDDACAHLTIVGTCPAATNEIVVSPTLAAQLGVRVGDTLRVSAGTNGATLDLKVTGEYQRLDPGGPYWASRYFTGTNGGGADTLASDGVPPAFTTLDTFGQPAIVSLAATIDRTLPVSAFNLGARPDLAAALARASYDLPLAGVAYTSGASQLAATIANDVDLLEGGVAAGVVQLVLLCWYALFLAARYAASQRRPDAGVVRLRGAFTSTLVRLSAGQTAGPMLGGLAAGALIAATVVRFALPPVVGAPRVRLCLELTAIAAGATLLGALVAIGLAEATIARAPIGDLLRRVPARRRGLRTDLTDLLIVMLAAAAAYQTWAQRRAAAQPGLTTLAAALVALGVSLIAARLVGYAAGRAGAAALRTGRLRTALGALQAVRRPGTDRIFALTAVAVAGLCLATSGFKDAAAARSQRAIVDTGAARVLTVTAGNVTALLSAVRTVDPDGTEAMAVARYPGSDATGPIIAVDADRFARIATWPDIGPAPDAARIASLLQTATPPAVTVTGTELTIDAAAAAPAPIYLVARIADQVTGIGTDVGLGPLPAGRHVTTARLPDCTHGCRLVALRIAGEPNSLHVYAAPPGDSSITLYGIGQHGPDATVAGADVLGDVTRWRTDLVGVGLGLAVANADGHLTLAFAENVPAGLTVALPSFAVDTADTALPLPAVVAGARTTSVWTGHELPVVVGTAQVPMSVAGLTPLLPALGVRGTVVDLAALARLTSDADGVSSMQVWLHADAPPDIVARLAAAGLVVMSDESINGNRHRLDAEGPAAARRFQLLAALAGVLLAAAATAVGAAVERQPRAAELAALRVQGLSARSGVSIAYGAYVGADSSGAHSAATRPPRMTPVMRRRDTRTPPGGRLPAHHAHSPERRTVRCRGRHPVGVHAP